MSTQAQQAANILNSQHSTGPRTETGRANSSKNAITNGLFTAHDFIRPGEQPLYDELDNTLRHDLSPVGLLEHNLVDEIRRAMWRLRRCGLAEESIVESLTASDGEAADIPDPMQNKSTDRLQASVDRAQAHRLLHKCTAELRRLRTDRVYRDETFEAGTDLHSRPLRLAFLT